MKNIQLSLPEPCSENWNEMSNVKHGKHCGRCEKTVYDLTDKTNVELATFFSNQHTSICARIPLAKLGTPLHLQTDLNFPTIHLKAILLGAALITSLQSWTAPVEFSNHPISLIELLKDDTLQKSPVLSSDTVRQTFSFQVIDEKTKDPLPFAAVYLYDSLDNLLIARKTDFDGHVSFDLTEQQLSNVHSVIIRNLDIYDKTLLWKDIQSMEVTKPNLRIIKVESVDQYIVGQIYVKHPKKDHRKAKRAERKAERIKKKED